MAISNTVPIIDIHAFSDPVSSAKARQQVIENVRSACSEYGFLEVVGHGVPLATQKAVLDSAKRLFALPQDQKDALSLKNNPARRGYERIGEQVLDANALPDHKEATSRPASPRPRFRYTDIHHRATTWAANSRPRSPASCAAQTNGQRYQTLPSARPYRSTTSTCCVSATACSRSSPSASDTMSAYWNPSRPSRS